MSPPPQAARPTASASAATAATDAANLRLARSRFLSSLARSSSCSPSPRGTAPFVGLPDHVHVLRSPGQLHPCAASRKSLALRLVGVRHQDGHPHVARQVHDDLGRGPQVDRALDQPLDAAAAVRRLRRPSSIASFSGRTTAWQRSPGPKPVDVGARSVGPLSSSHLARRRLRRSPGIRLETPMKPATKVVAGRS